MKTLKSTSTLALALILGTTSLSFAGNHPALTYPGAALASANAPVQIEEVTPWHKGAIKYASGIMMIGAWYQACPVSHMILNSKHEAEVTLSNGKKIMLASAALKEEVEANLGKYAPFMYGASAISGDSSARFAQASLGSVSVVK